MFIKHTKKETGEDKEKIKSLANISLVFGIISLILPFIGLIFSILAITSGTNSLVRIKKTGVDDRKNKKKSMIAIFLGILGFLGPFLFDFILSPIQTISGVRLLASVGGYYHLYYTPNLLGFVVLGFLAVILGFIFVLFKNIFKKIIGESVKKRIYLCISLIVLSMLLLASLIIIQQTANERFCWLIINSHNKDYCIYYSVMRDVGEYPDYPDPSFAERYPSLLSRCNNIKNNTKSLPSGGVWHWSDSWRFYSGGSLVIRDECIKRLQKQLAIRLNDESLCDVLPEESRYSYVSRIECYDSVYRYRARYTKDTSWCLKMENDSYRYFCYRLR